MTAMLHYNKCQNTSMYQRFLFVRMRRFYKAFHRRHNVTGHDNQDVHIHRMNRIINILRHSANYDVYMPMAKYWSVTQRLPI